MANDIQRLEQKPLSDADLRTILGDSLKIIKYSELASVESLEALLPKSTDYCILLYETKENSGHWVALTRYTSVSGQDRFEFFDPYGYKPDSELRWVAQQSRESLGEGEPYLTKLIQQANANSSYPRVQHSPYHFEKLDNKINTCGHHSAHRIYRLIHNNMDLHDYWVYMEHAKEKLNMNYDEVVAEFVQSFGI